MAARPQCIFLCGCDNRRKGNTASSIFCIDSSGRKRVSVMKKISHAVAAVSVMMSAKCFLRDLTLSSVKTKLESEGFCNDRFSLNVLLLNESLRNF